MPKGVYPRKPRAPKLYNPVIVARVAELYAAGATQTEVAATLKVSQKVIFTIMRRHGITARVAAKRDQTGEKNSSWRGDKAGYQAFHRRLYALLGKPSRCSQCGTEEASFYDYANLTGDYADINDYAPMCRSCHWKFDGKAANFSKRKEGCCA